MYCINCGFFLKLRGGKKVKEIKRIEKKEDNGVSVEIFVGKFYAHLCVSWRAT